MDPKKKRQYIILGTVCVVLAVGFVAWTRLSVPEVEPIEAANPQEQQFQAFGQPAKTGADTVYAPPAVFPQNRGFDTLVIGQLKTFQNFQPSKLSEGDLGRTNPFNNY